MTRLNLKAEEKIIEPLFYEQLKGVGFELEPKEYKKLWRKYDQDNLGVIDVTKFTNKLLGTSQSRMSVLSDSQSEREQSINIEKWLNNKFREGLHDMFYAFKEFGIDDHVTRQQFLIVLKDYGLFLSEEQLDIFLERYDSPLIIIYVNSPFKLHMHLLSENLSSFSFPKFEMFVCLTYRCNVARGPRINYKEFLQVFQDRSDNGVTNKIMTNPKHRYVCPFSYTVATFSSAFPLHLLPRFR